MAIQRVFEPYQLVDHQIRYGTPYTGEAIKKGSPLVSTAGYLYVATIDTDVNILGIAAKAMTGDSSTTCPYYPTVEGNRFITKCEDTTAQIQVDTVVALATITNEADGIDNDETTTAPVFLIEGFTDEDLDGTNDHAYGMFVDTKYGGKADQ